MAEEKKPELIKCPCCGKITLEAPVKVNQDDLDKYIASIVSGVPYQKSYKLHRGAVSITVADCNDTVKDKMNLLITRTSQEVDEDLQQAQQLFMIRLFTLLPIVSIKVVGETDCNKDIQAVAVPLLDEALQHYKEKEWLDAAYKRLMDPEQVTAVPKALLDKVVAKHMENCAILTDSGFDQDFFEGIVQG